jgi:DNA-binding CsgD family transcriptional regulator
MKPYCTQNNGLCHTCSLNNYGRDCQNNPALTEMEYEVAMLVKQAKRNKEIADELGIAEGTVRTHLRSIFKKLKIKSRAELIIKEL